MTTTTASTPTCTKDSYLTLVPRGLVHVVLEGMETTLSPHYLKCTIMGEQENQEEHVKRLESLLVHKAANKKKKQKTDVSSTCCHEMVGTVRDEEINQHFSVGYYSCPKHSIEKVMSHPGHLEGVVWIQFETDAPVDLVANKLRCIGPLVAFVQVFDNIQLDETQSLQEATASVQQAVASSQYSLDAAIQLWYKHTQQSWSISKREKNEIDNIIKGNAPMKFRLSCLRNQSKKYQYTREDLLRSVADMLVPPAKNRQEHDTKWIVDLGNFNLEVALLARPKCLAIGLSLRPYRHYGAKCFASGTMPPDISAPYLTGNVVSGLVRLRPSTAHLLLYLAKLEQGDVVLDPCAGIGTIPMELPHLVSNQHAFGLGGDLVLTTPSGVGSVAFDYIQQVKRTTKNSLKSDLLAWDATNLPLRQSSVDVIVSDLPFGQQCMSSCKLDGFLPLLMGEAARVLIPNTGRMVLLCGSYVPILEALVHLNHVATQGKADTPQQHDDDCVWTLPCTAVFPVNVGGLLAWIIQVQRGPGKAVRVPNHRERVKKATRKRELTERHRQEAATTAGDRQHKYRGIQSH